MNFDQAKARELAEKIIDAEAELSRYLKQCFPAGARCGVILMSGQSNPTPGVILSTGPSRYGGFVNVRIDTQKRGSRHPYRSVNAIDVTILD